MAQTRRAKVDPKTSGPEAADDQTPVVDASDAPAANAPGPSDTPGAANIRVLKKYPNRRLYDTHDSTYITLADVKKMVLGGQDFVVRDARSNEDLTRPILLQIILEEETGGLPMFTSQTLAQIIRFYGHAMQGVMGSYLEKNLQALAEMQTRIADPAAALSPLAPDAWTKLMSGQAPMMQNFMGSYLEQSKKLFEQMQEQMSKPGESIFPIPGFPPTKR